MRVLILISIIALASCQLYWSTNSFRPKMSAQTDKDNLNKVFAGIWKNVNLDAPVQLINCFDEQTAADTNTFIGQFLTDIGSGDNEALVKDTTNFTLHFPPASFKCIRNDPEVAQMLKAYNITNRTPKQILQEILAYIKTNLPDLQDKAGAAYFDWYEGRLEQAGVKLGGMLAEVFNSKTALKTVLKEGKDDLNKVFAGIWENVKLKAPIQLIKCFDDKTAADSNTFIGQFLTDIGSGDSGALDTDTDSFIANFPSAVSNCINADPEVAQMLKAYKTNNKDFKEIVKEIIYYIKANLPSLQDPAGAAYFDWYEGRFQQAGNKLGAMLGQAFNHKSFSAIKGARDDLQNLFNGLFEIVQLPGPQTALNCYNDHDAQVTIHFFTDVISDIANNNYPNLVREYNVYKNSLPKNVTDCINSNSELNAVWDAYGLNSETAISFTQKYAKYYIGHHQELVSAAQKIDAENQDHSYYPAGRDTGVLLQKIISGKTF